MYVKVNPSGCCTRHGMVQVRLDMYLDTEDYNYNQTHIQVPVISPKDYTGKLNDRNMPVDMDDYNTWASSLPKVWLDNPFHNHFIQVRHDTTDKEILDIAEVFLSECYIKWASDISLIGEQQPTNKSLPFTKPTIVDAARIVACKARVASIKEATLERRI